MWRINKRIKVLLFLIIIVVIISTFSKIVIDVNSGAGNKEPRNLALGLEYEISEPASDEYPDLGNQLTDGKYGSLNYQNPSWQGHLRGLTRSVIFDLGSKKTINEIKTSFLAQESVGIQHPLLVSFYASNDKNQWSKICQLESGQPKITSSSAEIQEYTWDSIADGIPNHPKSDYIYAQYIQVRFKPAVWAFIDEVEIIGYDGKLKKTAQLSSDDLSDPTFLASGEASTNIDNLVLLYNGWYESGAGNWTKDNIIPYISYVDIDGQPQDWLFDGVLYLGLKTPEGRDFHSSVSSTKVQDWEWYLDKTFNKDGEMAQLNLAVEEVAEKLEDPKYKLKTVLMIPYPSYTMGDFGEIGQDETSYSFNHEEVGEEKAFENRKNAVKWYIDEVLRRWEEGNYDNLQLDGLYWVSETVHDVPYEEELIQYASSLIHDNKMRFYWIPYFTANKIYLWEDLGFDAAYLQPNHFFNDTDESRIEEAAQLGREYGMGMEIEFDERMNSDKSFKEKYIHYLDGGIKYGYLADCIKAYYQGCTALLDASKSNDPEVRENYDMIYEFIKGTYTKQ